MPACGNRLWNYDQKINLEPICDTDAGTKIYRSQKQIKDCMDYCYKLILTEFTIYVCYLWFPNGNIASIYIWKLTTGGLE